MSTHEDRRLEDIDKARRKTVREIDITVCRKEGCQSGLHTTAECELTTCLWRDSEREGHHCNGDIEIHKGNARCRFHSNKYWDNQNTIARDYPDSNIPPDWFDPTLAGERWDDDY